MTRFDWLLILFVPLMAVWTVNTCLMIESKERAKAGSAFAVTIAMGMEDSDEGHR